MYYLKAKKGLEIKATLKTLIYTSHSEVKGLYTKILFTRLYNLEIFKSTLT